MRGTVDVVTNFASELDPSNSVPGYPYVLGVHELGWSVEPVGDVGAVGAVGDVSDVVKFGDEQRKAAGNVSERAVVVATALEDLSYRRLPHTTLIAMDRMGPEWLPCWPEFTVRCSNRFLVAIHRKSFTHQGRTYRSVFNYRDRHLYYSVTNAGGALGYPIASGTTSGDDHVDDDTNDNNDNKDNDHPHQHHEERAYSGWNTRQLLADGSTKRFPDGLYRLTVRAKDWFGNEGTSSVVVQVKNQQAS